MLTLIFALAVRLVARVAGAIAARLSHLPAVSLHSGRAIAISGKTAIEGVVEAYSSAPPCRISP